MKQMKRMLSAVLAAAVLAAGFALTSFASDDGQEQEIPRIDESQQVILDSLCESCRAGKMKQSSVQYQEWQIVDRTPCNHGDFWAWDEVQERQKITLYVCSSCDAVVEGVRTEQQTAHHYNR